jgi:hypothetical protein
MQNHTALLNCAVADVFLCAANKNEGGPPVVGGMLRLVNVHDMAPDVPSAVRVPFFR